MSELVNPSQTAYNTNQHHYDPTLVTHTDPASAYIQNAPPPSAYNQVLQPHQGEHNPPLVSNQSQSYDMLPPPETTFDTFADLHAFAQSHAAAHGYALSINTTAKNRARVKLACVCYGAPKNTHKLTEETRVRKNRASAKTGCRMWVEGKKMEDGTWVLRVGEATHNHAGRNVEDWSVHRRRTWGMGGTGGGIVAGAVPAGRTSIGGTGPVGEVVWRIVEAEMSRGMHGGDLNQSTGARDRGVGRTVKVLQDKLPGIRIFKRDIYNIRAQIKKARKEAEARVAAGDTSMLDIGVDSQAFGDLEAQLDPQLVEHANQAMRAQRAAQNAASAPPPPPPPPQVVEHSPAIHSQHSHNAHNTHTTHSQHGQHNQHQHNPHPPLNRPPYPDFSAPPQHTPVNKINEDEILQLRIENQDVKEQLERFKTENARLRSELEEERIGNQTKTVEVEQLKLQLLFSRRQQPAMNNG